MVQEGYRRGTGGVQEGSSSSENTSGSLMIAFLIIKMPLGSLQIAFLDIKMPLGSLRTGALDLESSGIGPCLAVGSQARGVLQGRYRGARLCGQTLGGKKLIHF